MAVSGLNRHGGRSEDVLGQGAVAARCGAGCAGEDQVLVERRFEGSGISGAQDGSFDPISNPNPRLRPARAGNSVVAIEPETGGKDQAAHCDCVLHVECGLIDVLRLMKEQLAPAACQVER